MSDHNTHDWQDVADNIAADDNATSAADVDLDDVASRALAAIILERTADAMRNGGENAGDALTGLVDDTGLVIDVCAAILQATSWIAGTGEVTDEALFAASLALTPDDADEESELAELATYPAKCPQCGALRPAEMHLEWCQYDGPEPGDADDDNEGDSDGHAPQTAT